MHIKIKFYISNALVGLLRETLGQYYFIDILIVHDIKLLWCGHRLDPGL